MGKSKMKKFKIPIYWIEQADVEVEAENLEQAITMVNEGNCDFPKYGEYVDCSTEINIECAYEMNNSDGVLPEYR